MKHLLYIGIFLTIFSCKKDDCEPCNNTVIDNTPKSIIGTWLRYDTLEMQIVELSFQNNSFTVSSEADTMKVVGAYSIDNSRIFFLQDNLCDSAIGIYDFEFPSTDKLRFTVISDTCEYSRKALMNGDWIKK